MMRWMGIVLMCLLTLGCEESPAPVADTATPGQRAPEEPAGGNLLLNASFEGGTQSPWFDFSDRNPKAWGAMAIGASRQKEGNRAALLELDSEGVTEPVRVLGAVQEISGDACPAYVSGWYLVEHWERGCEKQYLQVVAIASGGQTPPGVTNYQVARTLAGVPEAPIVMKNRRFEIDGPVEPVIGEWVFFEIDLAAMFQRQWKLTPSSDATLRLFFEVRYDGRSASDPRAQARVWFDDLYAGPASREASGSP